MKELWKIFEDTTTKNIKSILQHGNETRKQTKELEEKLLKMEKQIRLQNETIEGLRNQLVVVQSKLYQYGS